ncbi:Mpp10 protein [Trichomonas vaginalis G3]|uniref:Mpp10 protein n=1 Tax=Trichomonas vaginalis (strain ATCC PRA-98 / G3) TaxID=412133 RepID=A2DEA6_TRIV3|nr:maturation of SSU-rRNA [Trichomonas vaginalis G3]EAY21324.1 Mpp10 protein [Trichomonas vaginalis G3]KAI5548939.1 maturation of SSU-rRNA [Trichomonas vaginalis G3]|eukprot:XP_001582310.1 Mpp10 protein [Trichomonas vaginalis G3]
MFEEIHNDSSIIIGGNEEQADFFLEMASAFFTATKESEISPNAAGKLDKLITKGFGQFAIWQQINVQNKAVLESARNAIEELNQQEEHENQENIQNEEEDEEDDEDIKNLLKERNENQENEEDFNENNEEEEQKQGEDEEYNYSDFEFDKDGIQNAHLSDENLEEEDDEDMYGEEEDGLAPEGEEDDDDTLSAIIKGEAGENDDAKYMSYKDFYGDEDPDALDADNRKAMEDEEAEETGEKDEIQQQISEIEKQMLEPKPWHLMGEASAGDRPKDSLADIEIDFAVSNSLPPDPLPAKELEALLIRRIEAMNFDDVVRKRRPTRNPQELEQISSAKSKKSLTELYEEELTKTREEFQNEGPQFTQQQTEAIEMWKSLEHELNRFTEKRFMARRPPTKIQITNNKDAATLDAESRPEDTKAPEEIMKPVKTTREMKGEAEETHQERRSDRRMYKQHYKKNQEKRDAKKGVLYSQSGKDGAEVQVMNEVKKLQEGKLTGIEVYGAGQTIPDEQKKKEVKKNYLL